MITAGIDIGSRAIKIVAAKGKNIIHGVVEPNSYNTIDICRKMPRGIIYKIASTRYKHHLLPEPLFTYEFNAAQPARRVPGYIQSKKEQSGVVVLDACTGMK